MVAPSLTRFTKYIPALLIGLGNTYHYLRKLIKSDRTWPYQPHLFLRPCLPTSATSQTFQCITTIRLLSLRRIPTYLLNDFTCFKELSHFPTSPIINSVHSPRFQLQTLCGTYDVLIYSTYSITPCLRYRCLFLFTTSEYDDAISSTKYELLNKFNIQSSLQYNRIFWHLFFALFKAPSQHQQLQIIWFSTLLNLYTNSIVYDENINPILKHLESLILSKKPQLQPFSVLVSFPNTPILSR